MKLHFECSAGKFAFDSGAGTDVSIPFDFHGSQVNAYGVPPATAAALLVDGLPLDTRRGAGCNCERYELIAHCNGTHTECLGHITDERVSVRKVLSDSLVPATLVSVAPERGVRSGESYEPSFGEDDLIISRRALAAALGGADPYFLRALLIRTLPNPAAKVARRYGEEPAPFFSREAMRYVNELGVVHLLVDLPSVDRMRDEGRLSAHHIFWQMPAGSHDRASSAAAHRTITELIYVDDRLSDGKWLLNLQIGNFESDAAPARPLLFAVERIS